MDGPRQGGGGPVARCVLWHAAGSDAPAELEAKLRARGIEVVSVRGPYAALAEICSAAHEPDRVAASNGDPPPRRPLSLVLVNPGSLPGAPAVLRCVERFAPRAVVWDYDPGPPPRLTPTAQRAAADDRGFDAPVRASDNPPGPGPARDHQPRAARLRLTDPGMMDPPHATPDDMMGPARPGREGDPPRQLLSAEELSMLLDEGEPGSAPRA